MLAVLGGGAVGAIALRDAPPVPVAVGDGVAILPPPEWEFAARLDPQPGVQSGIVLTRGDGSLLVYTAGGTPAEQLDDLRADLSTSTLVSIGDVEPAEVRSGQEALRFAYSGAVPDLAAYPVEGEAIVVQGSNAVVVFFTWAAIGEYQFVRPQVEDMIGEATIP